jgi:hypothetical protein
MIEVRPLNPVQTVSDRDPLIASFADSEWWDLLKLARRYGFEPPDIQIHYPRPYDHPVELDAETSRGLWEAISAVYNDAAVPYATTWEESNTTTFFGRRRRESCRRSLLSGDRDVVLFCGLLQPSQPILHRVGNPPPTQTSRRTALRTQYGSGAWRSPGLRVAADLPTRAAL